MSYTWCWYTVWMNVSQLQLIADLFPCMRRRCVVMDPAVSSTSHSGHGICVWNLTWYESPTPVHFSAMASSNIPSCNDLGWQFIVRDFATLVARPYLLKRPTFGRSVRAATSLSHMSLPCHFLHKRLSSTAQRPLPVHPEPLSGILLSLPARFLWRCLPPR